MPAQASFVEPSPSVVWLQRAQWLLLLLPVVYALGMLLYHRDSFAHPMSDEAAIELAVRQAMHGERLVGAYSRYGWWHPGPLLFYLWVPVYVLGGEASVALNLAAAATSLLLLPAALRWCRPLYPGAVPWALAVASWAALLACVQLALEPSGYIVTWNPVASLLPLAALGVVTLRALRGSPLFALGAVALHAYVCQAYVGHVFVATTALAAALWGGAWAVSGRRRWTLMAGCMSLGLLLWWPPLLDIWWGDNNLGVLTTFFWDRTHEQLETSDALVVLLRRIGGLWTALAGDVKGELAAAPLIGLLQVLLCVAVSFWIWRRGARVQGGRAVAGWLVAVVLALVVSALNVGESSIPHLTHGFPVVMFWLVLGLLYLTHPLSTTVRGSIIAMAAAGAVTFVGALVQVRDTHEKTPVMGERVAPLLDLVDVLRPEVDRRPYPVLWRDGHAVWAELLAVALHFHKAGLEVRLDPSMAAFLGRADVYAQRPPLPTDVLFCDGLRLGRKLLATWDNVRVYSFAEVAITTVPVGSHVLNDAALRGDPRRDLVTLEVGPARLVGIEVSADSNEAYNVALAAADGHFATERAIEPITWSGLVTRVVLVPPGAWRFVRLSAGLESDAHAVAKIRPVASSWAAQEEHGEGASGSLVALSDGDLTTAVTFTKGGRVSLRLPEVPVQRVAFLGSPGESFMVSGSTHRGRFHNAGSVVLDDHGRGEIDLDNGPWRSNLRIRADHGELKEVILQEGAGQVFDPAWPWRYTMLGEGWRPVGENAPPMRSAEAKVVALRLPMAPTQEAVRVEAAVVLSAATDLRVQRADGWQQTLRLQPGWRLLSFTLPPGEPSFELHHMGPGKPLNPWLSIGRIRVTAPQADPPPAAGPAE